MKILIVGSQKEHALEYFYYSHFKNSIDVEIFPAYDIFLQYYTKSLFNKLLFRAGVSSIYAKINEELISLMNTSDFDVILVFKGMEIYPQTLKTLKKKAKLVNYNPDHPFYFHGRGSGNKNVTNGFEFFHHHLSYSHAILDQTKARYPMMPASYVPFGYQYASAAITSVSDEINRGVFVGTADKDRAQLIAHFIENSIPIDVYGNSWEKFLKPSALLNMHPPVFEEDFVATVQRYRFNLNFLRPHNRASHNMRTFELPALSCIVLAEYTAEQAQFFEKNKEAFFFNDTAEAVEIAKQLLALTFDQASEIKRNAYQRSLESGYGYEHRAKEALIIFEGVLQ